MCKYTLKLPATIGRRGWDVAKLIAALIAVLLLSYTVAALYDIEAQEEAFNTLEITGWSFTPLNVEVGKRYYAIRDKWGRGRFQITLFLANKAPRGVTVMVQEVRVTLNGYTLTYNLNKTLDIPPGETRKVTVTLQVSRALTEKILWRASGNMRQNKPPWTISVEADVFLVKTLPLINIGVGVSYRKIRK